MKQILAAAAMFAFVTFANAQQPAATTTAPAAAATTEKKS